MGNPNAAARLEGRESGFDGIGAPGRPWGLGAGRPLATGATGGPPSIPWDVLLGIQPVTGVFNTVTIRHQAASFRQPSDSLYGLWEYLWAPAPPRTPESRQRKSFAEVWLLPHRSSLFMFLYQAIEGWLLLWLTDRAHKLVKGCLSLVPRLSASPAPSPPSPPTSPLLPPTALVVASASSPAASFDWVLYGAVRSVLYPFVVAVSHPFSIVRTVFLVKGELLADGIRESFIAVMPSREASVYGRSYWAHVVSGLADFWLSELVYRASLPLLQRHFPNLFPPPQPLVRLVQVDEMLESRQARKATKIRRNLAIASLRFFSGFLGRTLAFPLSTLRYRLEAQGCSSLCEVSHDGLVSCLRSVLDDEGFSGLYRGFRAHCVSLVAQSIWMAGVFGLSHLSRKMDSLLGLDEDDEDFLDD